MAYFSDQMVGGTASDLVDEFKGIIDGHSSWEHIGTTSAGWEVFRSAFNDFGQQFFVAMGQFSSTVLGAFVFEDYDEIEEAIYHPCIRGNAVHDCNEDAAVNDTYWKHGESYGINGNRAFMARLTVTSGVRWFLSINGNRIIAGTDAPTSIYLGLFESFILNNPNEFPLLCMTMNQISTSLTSYLVGGWSRHPGREETSHKENFAVYPFNTNTRWTQLFGAINGDSDPFHGGPVGSRLMLRALSTGFGHARGIIYDVLNIVATSITPSMFDFVTINGQKWISLGHGALWINTEEAM